MRVLVFSLVVFKESRENHAQKQLLKHAFVTNLELIVSRYWIGHTEIDSQVVVFV